MCLKARMRPEGSIYFLVASCRISMFFSHPLAASTSSRRSGSAALPSQGREIETKGLSAVIKTFTHEQIRDGRMAQGFARAELVVCSPSTNDPK